MSKLIILSTQRTGSSALFYKFEDCMIGYEPFNSEDSRSEFIEIIETDYYRNRLENPLEYIDYLFEFVECIKIQMELIPGYVLKEILTSLYEKVMLSRNHLDQFRSLKTAQATDQWWLNEGEVKREVNIDFDISEFREYSKKMTDLYTFARRNVVNCTHVRHHEN